MWHRLLTLAMLTTVTKTSHISKNDSDVIVTYSGHAEAMDPPKSIILKNNPTATTEEKIKILIPESFVTETTRFYEEVTDGVVFVPNEKQVFRNEDYYDGRVNVGDVMTRKTVANVLDDKRINIETESPPADILFISGQNNENIEKPVKEEKEYQKHFESRRSGKETKPKIHFDCSNLDCNNTLKSVCGGKMEHSRWRYRLFLNECYFRKVNCDFRYDENRFKEMPDEFCKPIGSHLSARPIVYHHPTPPRSPALRRQTPGPVVMRRTSSRRSLNMESDGSFCSHSCPQSCPEEYSPECAVNSSGQRKMFVNHCKLDYNSCTYGTVWQKRPLSDCVGHKKADLQQNRAFIGWMQRVGIVDPKGRLVLN